jgi:sodium transport system permease protein
LTRTATIFKKELTDILRDKRTILTMIVIPLALVPLLLTLIFKVAQRQQLRAEAEEIKIALIGSAYAPRLEELIAVDSQFTVVEGVAEADIENHIRLDSLDGALVIPPHFPDLVNDDQQASVKIYYRSSNTLNVTAPKLREVVDAYDDEIVGDRIRRLELDENLFDAIEIESSDVSTQQEVFGKTIGGFLPYVFILFMFTGAMYPGIDLGAGEKERGTLETLLSSPANRFEIVLGKFLVVSLAGFISALLAMVGMYLGVRGMGEIPPEAMEVVWDILSVKVVVLILTLLLPLAVFFGAAILAVSIYSKSFKEAQSSLTPVSIVIIVPVALGLLPGMELNMTTAFIPILNVSLATKDVIAGTINPVHLVVSYTSLVLLATASMAFAVMWFNREETLFRT